MQTLYKLTRDNGTTHNNTKWEVGTTHSLPKVNNPRLCTKDVLHAYKSPNLGLLLNPIHANFTNPLLFKCEGEVVAEDWSKVGCSLLTITEQLPLPKWYANADTRKKVQAYFAILCAESVLPDDSIPRKALETARAYLEGKATKKEVKAAAYAIYVAAYYAARAAYAAFYAAYAACAAYAAYYVANATANAACADSSINFIKLADEAVRWIKNE